MTTCKECNKAVATDAPTCPHCGTTAPAEGGAERDAAAKAVADKTSRQVALGCGGFVLLVVLLIGGGALWNELTKVELDEAARRACSGVTAARYGDGSIRQGAGQVQAVASARESSVESLLEAVGIEPVTHANVNARYTAVRDWCDEATD